MDTTTNTSRRATIKGSGVIVRCPDGVLAEVCYGVNGKTQVVRLDGAGIAYYRPDEIEFVASSEAALHDAAS